MPSSTTAILLVCLAPAALLVAGQASSFSSVYSSRADPNVDDPIVTVVDGRTRLEFPSNARIPRFETDTEREFLSNRTQASSASDSAHRKLLQGPNSCACGFDSFCCSDWDEACQLCEFGWATEFGCPAAGCPFGDDPFAPPRGSLFTPGEFEPNEGILLAYEGPPSWQDIVAQMAAAVTTQGGVNGQSGGGMVYLVVATNLQISAGNKLASFGADMSKVVFQPYNANTIWIRDYGPRFTYENGARVMIDHLYNRFSRLQDNNQPKDFGEEFNVKRYLIGDNTGALVHGGGNYHLDSTQGIGLATNLIVNENSPKNSAGIIQLWETFQNLVTDLTAAYPTNVDSTQHIDMWLISVGPKKLIISDHILDPNTIQASVSNNVAAMYEGMGFEIFRTPAENSGFNGANGVHYTYTNSVIVNKIVLLPTYSNTQPGWNTQARQVWEDAMGPDFTIVQIQSQAIVTAAGVLHCICMHVPAFDQGSGRTAPIASITSSAADVVSEGEVFFVYDDDKFDITSASIEVLVGSNSIFSANLPLGSFDFSFSNSVSNQIQSNSNNFNVILCVEDGDGESDCDSLFELAGPPPGCPDVTPTGDNILNVNDVLILLAFIISQETTTDDPCDFEALDYDDSGLIDVSDVISVVNQIVE